MPPEDLNHYTIRKEIIWTSAVIGVVLCALIAVLTRHVLYRRGAQKELAEANQFLEERVRERTAELLAANERLTAQMDERDRMEEALRKSEEYVRGFIENVDDMVYFQGLDGSLSMLNTANARITGYSLEEFAADPLLWTRLVHPEDLAVAEEFFAGKAGVVPSFEVEYRLRDKSGHWRWIHSRMVATRDRSGAITGYNCIDRDITDRKTAERLLIQDARLKAIGEMAGGVAHNFNNLLQIVVGSAQMGLIELENGDASAVKARLQQILDSAVWGANTVKRLQTFSRVRADENEEFTGFDLSETVRQAIQMSRPWWKTAPEREGIHVKLESRLEEGCVAYGTESELFEVTVNLIKNAAEALPNGGLITVRTSKGASEVCLVVQDNGVGIDQNALEHVYDPFWTTKGMQGTGLGLSTCYGIVERHRGTISAHSEIGQGTSFTVILPAADCVGQVHEQTIDVPCAAPLNIMVVDDLPAVTEQLKAGLERIGHSVITAHSGGEAITMFQEVSLDVIVSDLGMPGMNGWQLGKTIREICRERNRANPVFILMTGWGGQIDLCDKISESGVDMLLEKPVTLAMLTRAFSDLAPHGKPP
jgi:PAS domain S-box-containing protein